MYKLAVSELAHDDLRNILTYIRDTLCASKAASDFADEVHKCYAHLKSNPLMFAVCNDERLAKAGCRKALIKNYILVFKVDEEKKAVSIYRFLYGAQDYPNKI